MSEVKLPRGALKDATAAVIAVADYLGTTCQITEPTQAQPIARAALEAALPVIERAVQRETARHILALDAADLAKQRNVGPWNDTRTTLRRLARGEPLPDLPTMEKGENDA
jgi:hypothetical protein